MLKWFRDGPSPHQTALAMIGAKAGDRILVAGEPDAALVAEVARVTGLNGQTTAAVSPDHRAAVEQAAAKAGSLVDVVELARTGPSRVPALTDPQDIVVLMVALLGMATDARAALIGDALAAVRPGGRLVAFDPAKRGGLLGARHAPTCAPDQVVAALTSAGAAAARVLAETEGVAYFEARRAR